MAYTTNFNAISQAYLAPKAMDTILQGNVLAMRILGNAKPWQGKTMDKTIQVTKPNTGGSFSGLDTFDTNKSQTKVRLSFDPKQHYQSVVLEGLENDVNKSDPGASVNYVAEQMEEGANAMADNLGTILYQSDGTSSFSNGAIVSDSSNKNFLGLAAIIDDGSVAATYGGLSRSTYTTLQANRYAVSLPLALSQIATGRSAATKMGDFPNLYITTKTLWDSYESLLQATVVHNTPADGYKQLTRNNIAPSTAALKGDVGFSALYYGGQPFVADDKCPANRLFGINEKYLAFYGLKSADSDFKPVTVGNNKEIEGAYEEMGKNLGFHWSGFKKPVNQYAQIGQFLLQGNLISFNPNRHFVLVLS